MGWVRSRNLAHELQHDNRVTCQIVWGRPEPEALQGTDQEGDFLVYTTDTIFRYLLVQEISQQSVPEKSVVVTDASNLPLLALVPANQIQRVYTELRQGKPLYEISVLAGSNTIRIPAPHGQFLCRLTAATDLSRTEHELLRALENPRDGLVDTHFNRKFSRPITRWFLQTSLTPNQITFLACFVSVLGALCFLPGGYSGPLCGAVLLQFSAVLDCCDGEVARIKFMESPLGGTLDITCDIVGTIATFFCLGVAVWQDGETSQALGLAGVLALGGVLCFRSLSWQKKRRRLGDSAEAGKIR